MTLTRLFTVTQSSVRYCFIADLWAVGLLSSSCPGRQAPGAVSGPPPLGGPGFGLRPGAGRINAPASPGSRRWIHQPLVRRHSPAPCRSLPFPVQFAAVCRRIVDAARNASDGLCSAAGCGPPDAPSAPGISAAAWSAASPRSAPRRPRTDRAVFAFRFASSVCGAAAGWTATASADRPKTPPANGSHASDLLRPLPAPGRCLFSAGQHRQPALSAADRLQKHRWIAVAL